MGPEDSDYDSIKDMVINNCIPTFGGEGIPIIITGSPKMDKVVSGILNEIPHVSISNHKVYMMIMKSIASSGAMGEALLELEEEEEDEGGVIETP